MCVISHGVHKKQHIMQIWQSLNKQYNYSKYKYVYTHHSQIQDINGNYGVYVPNHVYAYNNNNNNDSKIASVQGQQLKKIIGYGCDKRSIIVMAATPLRTDALVGLNLLYQRYNIWMTSYLGPYTGSNKYEGRT